MDAQRAGAPAGRGSTRRWAAGRWGPWADMPSPGRSCSSRQPAAGCTATLSSTPTSVSRCRENGTVDAGGKKRRRRSWQSLRADQRAIRSPPAAFAPASSVTVDDRLTAASTRCRLCCCAVVVLFTALFVASQNRRSPTAMASALVLAMVTTPSDDEGAARAADGVGQNHAEQRQRQQATGSPTATVVPGPGPGSCRLGTKAFMDELQSCSQADGLGPTLVTTPR